MPSTRANSRAATAARTDILQQLKDDHKRVKKAYRDFNKLDLEDSPEDCEAIVQQVLSELAVHAALEEELLYPAARGAIAEADLIDEAEVEHESMHMLIDQLQGMGPDDEKYAARFTVLCEYVIHHVKEEEGEIFPQLESARLDWEGLAAQMNQRREELTAADAEAETESDASDASDADDDGEEVAAEETVGAGGKGQQGSADGLPGGPPPTNGVVRASGTTSRKI